LSPKKSFYLKTSADPFLNFLDRWYSELPIVSFKSLFKEYRPDQTALCAVDVVNGFCKEGNLSSSRIAGIVEPIADLFRRAEEFGMNHYALSQDNHPAESTEFEIYPPHCIEGSDEAKTVRELSDLPHAHKFKVLPKKTINPGIENNFRKWLDRNDDLRQFIVVGDCTDICVYLLSVFLKSHAVERDTTFQVIVPENCVDTYDISVEAAEEADILPHPGEFLHRFFLYHMAIQGIKVVAEIA
jgi:nicotinamidase-related amidase